MADLNDLENDLSKMESEMKRFVAGFKKTIGHLAIANISSSFVMGAYNSGNSSTPWAERSENTNYAYDYHQGRKVNTSLGNSKKGFYSSTNPLLLQSHNLIDSIGFRVFKNYIEVGIYPHIVIINGEPHDSEVYGKQNNEGNTQTNLPQRQFMPKPDEGPNMAMVNSIEGAWKSGESKIMSKFR
jgi:hypothetical protein